MENYKFAVISNYTKIVIPICYDSLMTPCAETKLTAKLSLGCELSQSFISISPFDFLLDILFPRRVCFDPVQSFHGVVLIDLFTRVKTGCLERKYFDILADDLITFCILGLIYIDVYDTVHLVKIMYDIENNLLLMDCSTKFMYINMNVVIDSRFHSFS